MTTLPNSIQEIVNTMVDSPELNPSKVEEVIKRANVREEELETWFDFDHPLQDGYGRRLVYKGQAFEIMVMSWKPGDFSAIHDHGLAQFGAVQIFGEADHAIFSIDDGYMSTTSRWLTAYGDIVPVSHELIHQMGNPGKREFVSLHVYGTNQSTENVTAEARLFNIKNQKIDFSNGGAFFDLPKSERVRQEEGVSADFLTKLRYLVESSYQKLKAGNDVEQVGDELNQIYSRENMQSILSYLADTVDEDTGKVINQRKWQTLQLELKAIARLHEKVMDFGDRSDPFDEYAPLYDAIIGYNSFDFQKRYLGFFFNQSKINTESVNMLSVGCGTGMVEQWIIDHYSITPGQLLGLDIASSMVKVAETRINAIQKDFLSFIPESHFNIIFTGLNVFQYLSAEKFELAIRKASELTVKGGYFIGDFITPDHIRWYPNLMTSSDMEVLSFRTPHIIDSQPYQLQESEIINLSFLTGKMHAYDAGKHQRILPVINEVVSLFEKYFNCPAKIFDAESLQLIDKKEDTCPSTRYCIMIQKEKDR